MKTIFILIISALLWFRLDSSEADYNYYIITDHNKVSKVAEELLNRNFTNYNNIYFVIDGRKIPFVYTCAKVGLIEQIDKTKADINIRNQDGLTPLMLATRDQDHNAVIALITAGADCYITDNEGKDFFDYTNGQILETYEIKLNKKKNVIVVVLFYNE